jgi:hypothetical protein
MMARNPDPSEKPLPAPVPAAARAAISPSALVMAGTGAVIGLVAGGVAPAVIVGACCWGGRVGAAAARAARRRRRAQRPETIDPYAVREPWQGFVRESLTAQAKFDQTVARSQPGPLRERLAEVANRVHDGVRECWRVANLGAALDAARAGLDPEGKSSQLRSFQEHRARGQSAGAAGADDETEAALAAQLQAARRIEAAARRTTDRLRVLTAELNGAVASAVELSLDCADAAAAGELAGNVDSVVGEIESLRLALEETSGGGAVWWQRERKDLLRP